MQELLLSEQTRSERSWAWTRRNLARAADIVSVMEELRRWWPMTARQVYYRLISSDLVKQDHWHWKGERVDAYKALVRTLKWMRIDDMISWTAITDEHRVTTPKVGFSNTNEFFDYELENFLNGYTRCTAQKQNNYIEVWIEKAALLHIVKPIVDNFCRRVVVCRGYNSVTFQTQFYERASDAILVGQLPVVLYFGDWDPSGENMIFAAMQTLEDELDLCGVRYVRAGINPEHFDIIPADPVPIKSSDSRSIKFTEQYGPVAYELDAFHPEQLQSLVEESIIQFTDMDEFTENSEKEEIDRDKINELKEEVTGYVESWVENEGI